MNTTTKGIIGAVGAAAIGVGAYFGFSGGDNTDYGSENIQQVEVSEEGLLATIDSWFDEKGNVLQTDDNDKTQFHIGIEKFERSFAGFHLWSWHKFLYVTQLDKNNVPLFLSSDEYYLVDEKCSLIERDKSAPLELQINVQAGRNRARFNPYINEFNRDIENRNNLMFYSIHVNKTFYDHVTSTITKADSKSNLEDNSKINFPIGAEEYKVAWADATNMDEIQRSRYYITKGKINGKVIDIALMGMHVVASVVDHPEMIWATFENDNLAPDVDVLKKDFTPIKDLKISSKQEYSLYKQDEIDEYTTYDGIVYKSSNGFGKIADKVFRLSRYGVGSAVKSADGVFEGVEMSAEERKEYNLIDMINEKMKYVISTSKNVIWKNYFYNGSVWLFNNDNNKVVGSKLCANVTMETFTQASNCMDCHRVNKDRPNFTSHIYGRAFKLKSLEFEGNKKLVYSEEVKEKINTLIRMSEQEVLMR